MSTKTTFKRIALVAVAALGFGMLSVVPSNAGGVAGDAVALSTSNSSATVSVPTTTTATVTGYCVATGDSGVYALYVNSVPTGGTGTITQTLTPGTATGPVVVTQSPSLADATFTCSGAGFYSVPITASVTVASSGVYTFKIAGVYQAAGSQTWTVTATGKAAITAASSTLSPSATTITGPKGATGTSVGTIGIIADNATANADPALLSATVSGVGLVSFGGFGAAGRAVSAASALNARTLTVYGDGNAGTGVVSIYSGSTLLGTQSLLFYGTPASYKVTAAKSVVLVSGAAVNAITVSSVDSNGSAVPLAGFGTLTLTSDATSSIASTLGASDTVSAGCSVTVVCYTVTAGATAGSATLTVKDTTNTLTANTVSVRASDGIPTKVTFSTDATSYPAGGLGTLTVTISNAAGTLPAGGYAVLTGSATSSLALVTGVLPSGTVTVGNAGTTTVSFNAPLTDGTATITGTAAASTIAIEPVSFDVVSASSNVAQAAADAAAEATDAANAATDAANAAAEAADAATAAAQDAADAVAALSAQVADLIAGLKAQLTALTNLVIKIQKKVKA